MNVNKISLYIISLTFILSCNNKGELLKEKQKETIKEINIQKQFEQRASFLEKENEDIYKKLYLDDSSNYEVKDVYEETRKVLKGIRLHRYNLIKKFGGYTQEGTFREIKNDSIIYNYFFVNKNGEKLKTLLKDYLKFLDEKGVKTVSFILDGNEDPLFRKDPNLQNLKFEEIYFKESNLINVLNVLSLLSTEVLSAERMFYCSDGKEI